jgi:cell division protein FtsA
VDIDAFGSQGKREVPRRQICEIIQARMEEIMEMVSLEVKRAGFEDMISAGIVLTGGGANLKGIVDLGEQVTGLPVRTGRPKGLHGLADSLGDPAYATSVGVLLWAIRENQTVARSQRPKAEPIWSNVIRRFSSLARIVLPQ